MIPAPHFNAYGRKELSTKVWFFRNFRRRTKVLSTKGRGAVAPIWGRMVLRGTASSFPDLLM